MIGEFKTESGLSMSRLVMKLTRKVKEEKLSGQVLKNKTGRLRRSIHPEVGQTSRSLVGTVGTNVVYAGIHEYGGQTRPHVIEAKRAAFLAFMGKDGNMVFRRKVNHPGSRLPERSFLRSALKEMTPEIVREFENAITRVVRR
jgi:phage gpG-like protein